MEANVSQTMINAANFGTAAHEFYCIFKIENKSDKQRNVRNSLGQMAHHNNSNHKQLPFIFVFPF